MNEYLDMKPEDYRLMAIDNVFLLRHSRRLPYEKRGDANVVRCHHENFPIDCEVVWRFTQEIQTFVNAGFHNAKQVGVTK